MTGTVSNKQSLSVPPDSSTLIVIPLTQLQAAGNLYTVVLQYAESGVPESVAGGRLLKAHFPIESWPKSSECPFPTINDDNFKVFTFIFDQHIQAILCVYTVSSTETMELILCSLERSPVKHVERMM